VPVASLSAEAALAMPASFEEAPIAQRPERTPPVAAHPLLPAWLTAPGIASYVLMNEYKPEKFWVRFVEMVLALVLALGRSWPTRSTGDVVSHTVLTVVFTLAVLATLLVQKPYSPEVSWGLPIKVANLILLLVSACLVHVCQLLIMEQAGNEEAALAAFQALNSTALNASAPAIASVSSRLQTGYNVLNTLTFALFVSFFVLVLYVFLRSLVASATLWRLEQEAASGAAVAAEPLCCSRRQQKAPAAGSEAGEEAASAARAAAARARLQGSGRSSRRSVSRGALSSF
jgi:hypothetical protein